VLIAAAVPIVWVSLASLGRTGAAARDITGLEVVRRPAAGPAPRLLVPDVRLAQLRPAQPTGEPLSFRNPFEFAPRSLSPRPGPSVSIPPPLGAPRAGPSSVALSLIGIATTSRPDGRAERTAIIAGPADALYLVRDGDAVMMRYRVDAVLPDSVRLVDTATGASLLLTLR
jgi:hypothetical protein